MKKSIIIILVLLGQRLSALSIYPSPPKPEHFSNKLKQLYWGNLHEKVDSNSRFRKGNSYFSLGAVSSTFLNNDAFYSPLGEPLFPLALQIKYEYALSDRLGIGLNTFHQYRQGFLQKPYPDSFAGLGLPANSPYRFQQYLYGMYPMLYLHSKKNRLIHHYFGIGFGIEGKNRIVNKNDIERASIQYDNKRLDLLLGVNTKIYKNVKIYLETSILSLNFGLLYQFQQKSPSSK